MKTSNIFTEKNELKCSNCGKNLLDDIGLSMVQIITDQDDNIVQVNPCCKGMCDKKLLAGLSDNLSDGWKELSTFTNPYLYLKHFIAIHNNLFENHKFTNEKAFKNYKDLLIAMAPYVMRDLTDGEKESAVIDNQLPF